MLLAYRIAAGKIGDMDEGLGWRLFKSLNSKLQNNNLHDALIRRAFGKV